MALAGRGRTGESRSMRIIVGLVLIASFTFAVAQQTPAPEGERVTVPYDRATINALLHKQFGDQYTLHEKFASPVLLGDFDRDGVQDAAFVVEGNAAPVPRTSVKVIDPYDAYFGMGDARITGQFTAGDPRRPRMLLIIHGAGADAWRAETPKAKFIVINMPFDKLSVTRFAWKKRDTDAITAEETAMMTSVLFWNGKKYQWVPSGSAE